MKWLRLVIPAGATILLLAALALLTGPSPALAADNLVRVQPSGVNVAPGGTFKVAVIDDPSPATTAVWAIDLVYDPDVLSTTTEECDPIDTPGGGIGAFDCQVVDANNDGKDETVKPLGVFLYSGTGKGLNQESDLADITFHAVGQPGACTDLHLRIRNHADSDGNETGALVQDGRVCIKSDAPPSGTATANPVTPRTSEPTEVPTQPGTSFTATPANTQQSPSSGTTRPTDTSSPSGSATARTASPATSPVGGSVEVDNGGGGTSPLVYVLLGVVALVVVGGGALTFVRLRGGRPPSSPAPPDAGAPS